MYQKSQPEATMPGSESIRARLDNIRDRTAAVHGRLDGTIEAMFGPRLQEVSGQVNQNNTTLLNILDAIDYRIHEIERGIEFLSART